MKKLLLLATIAASLSVTSLTRAGSVTVDNFDITAYFPASTPLTGTISAMWGTYSSGVFTPYFSNTQSPINTGYLATADNELQVVVTQSDNTIITAGSSMFISIFNVPGGAGDSVWSATAPQIVLSDPAWIAPSFTLTTPELSLPLSANTVAMPQAQFGGQTGTYDFNGGSPQVTAVPEPSTYALLSLAGMALGGYAIRRRRRA